MRNRVPPRNYQTEVPTQLGPVDKVPLGIKMPFGRDNEFGFFGAITSTRERYHTNLKMLLMTAKGERPMVPEYGSELKALLFEQNTEAHLDSLLEDAITAAVERWMPEILIEEVLVTRDTTKDSENFYAANIKVTYSVVTIPASENELEITVEV